MDKYTIIEHVADVGIEVSGDTEAEALINAAYGMFDLMCDMSRVASDNIEVEIEVEAEDRETLLVEWLNELLYQFEAKRFMPRRFEIDFCSEHRIKGRALGEDLDVTKHKCGLEIKAVTFHMLKFEKTDDHWEAQIIFDV